MTVVHRTRDSRLLSFAREVGYGTTLLPAGVGAAAAAVAGRGGAARRWLRAEPAGAAGPVRLFGHALLTTVLGVLSLIPVGVEVMFVLRGVLYGFVDRGPYQDSWGGPTKAGAWLAHFAIGLPFAAAALVVLLLLARLQRLAVGRPSGSRSRWWVMPTIGLCAVGAALLIRAWIHQL